jgi:hypothetical protein
VGVVPITHRSPAESAGGLELPPDLKRQLGLDVQPQWVIFDEINRFTWPGYDLRRVPRTNADSYGMSPEPLFQEILRGVLTRHRARKRTMIDRD